MITGHLTQAAQVPLPATTVRATLRVQASPLMTGSGRAHLHVDQGVVHVYAPLSLLDLTAVTAAYVRSGHGAALCDLLNEVGTSAWPTHHVMPPAQLISFAQALDDPEDETPPLRLSFEPTGAPLPTHLAAHTAAVRAAARVARKWGAPFATCDGPHVTLPLLHADDRDELTRVLDHLEWRSQDEPTVTVHPQDLPDLHRVARAGRALWTALLTVPA